MQIESVFFTENHDRTPSGLILKRATDLEFKLESRQKNPNWVLLPMTILQEAVWRLNLNRKFARNHFFCESK
jgi:hypothetical protein